MTKTEVKINQVEVLHQGAQIILPLVNGQPMSYAEGCRWMKRKEEEENQNVSATHMMEGQPLDSAVAFQKAMAKKYGWTALIPTPGFFGDNPPQMIGVAVSPVDTIQVPLGRIQVPGLDGYIETIISGDNFYITSQVKQRHAEQVNEIVALTKKFLKEESIYKGRAIKIDLSYKRKGDEKRNFHPLLDAPRFMDIEGINDDDLIFSEATLHAINIGVFTPIEYAAACRLHKVPLKRGALLYGPYGTGKTLTASVTARKGVRNGWTFVYLDSVKDLKAGLDFAAQYAPAILFAEDIDRVVQGDRSLSMDDILNTLDGVDTKNGEIMTIFTTNHIEIINPALLRMGRLDTLVEVTPPDAKAAEKLVALYARGLLEEKASLIRIGKALQGQIPAFIREVTERAKIAAISRLKGKDIAGHVLEEDLLAAAKAMENHASMLKPKEQETGEIKILAQFPSLVKEGHKKAS